MRNFNLSSRIAIVTGGATGLGRGAAEALSEAGATVFILGRREQCLREAALVMGCRFIVCDVTDPANVNEAFEEVVRSHGRIDILVNAAGVSIRGSILEYSLEDWDFTHRTNCRGSFLTSVAAARAMEKTGGGKIINYCSYGSANGLARSAAYASSKGGVRQLTKSMAIELAPLNIQVNAIEPGWFETEMTADLYENQEWVARSLARIPSNRFGKARDLDGAVLFLASGLSDYVTGIMVPVDGGAQAV